MTKKIEQGTICLTSTDHTAVSSQLLKQTYFGNVNVNLIFIDSPFYLDGISPKITTVLIIIDEKIVLFLDIFKLSRQGGKQIVK